MKRNALIWGVLWVASIVLISFRGGVIPYSLFTFLTLVPIVSLAYLLYIYFFFHMYQKVDSKWLVVDDTTPFYFSLVNDYQIIFAGIRVKFYSDFSSISGLDEKTEYEFFPMSGIDLDTVITCKVRGEYEVGIKTVVIQDYFRLFTISYKNREPLKVVVRPKLVRLERLSNVDISRSVRENSFADSEPDVLVRGYVVGDDLRHIHWGLTAKSGELMTRKRTGDEQQGIGLVLFTERHSETPREYLFVENKMLETLLAVSLYLAERKIPLVHYHKAGDVVVKTVNSMAQFDEYYEFVSGIAFDKTYKDEELLSTIIGEQALIKAGMVVIVASSYNDMLGKYLVSLNERNTDGFVYFVGEALPEELSALSLARIKITLINPEDNLLEVLK